MAVGRSISPWTGTQGPVWAPSPVSTNHRLLTLAPYPSSNRKRGKRRERERKGKNRSRLGLTRDASRRASPVSMADRNSRSNFLHADIKGYKRKERWWSKDRNVIFVTYRRIVRCNAINATPVENADLRRSCFRRNNSKGERERSSLLLLSFLRRKVLFNQSVSKY